MSNYSVFNLRTMETYTPSVHGQGVVIAGTGYSSRRFVKASGAIGKGQGRIIGGKSVKDRGIDLHYYQILLPRSPI